MPLVNFLKNKLLNELKEASEQLAKGSAQMWFLKNKLVVMLTLVFLPGAPMRRGGLSV